MATAKSHNPHLVAIMTERKKAYSLVFGGPDVPHRSLVMRDLGRFCRERESTFHADARLAANLDGRREVMLRIRDYLDLSIEDLCNKYGRE